MIYINITTVYHKILLLVTTSTLNMTTKAKSQEIKNQFQQFVYLLDVHYKLLIFRKKIASHF